MNNRTTLLVLAALFVTACATKPAPPPAPTPPAAAPVPAPPPPPPPPPPLPPPPPPPQKVSFSADALFVFDRAVIRPEAEQVLDDLANRIRAVNVSNVSAVGHTDRIGAAGYNQVLSERRAQAVKAYLVSRGIDGSRIATAGKGEAQPVTGDKCNNMGKEDRSNKKLVACLQPDRRVDVEIQGSKTQ